MSDANPERGEVLILLDGKPYPMRPSYSAMQAIEQKLGPLLALVTRLAHPAKRLTIDEMAFVVAETIRAAGQERDDAMLKGVTYERVAEMIYSDGLINAIDPLEALLINMISGGGKAKKKASESPAKKKR